MIQGFVSPDQLFASLDGREFEVDEHTWRVEIFGISDLSDVRWVQLGLAGDRSLRLTMKLSLGDSEQRAVLLLSSWLAKPSHTHDILNVV